MNNLVIKFGGTSVMDPVRIKNVAAIIDAVRTSGAQVVVVVSAMGHTTDQLFHLAAQVSDSPDPRELDMLVSTGEQVAAALLALALQDRGIQAQSFTGGLAGVVTDGQFGQAKIKHVHCESLENCLALGIVPVVAGYQGLSQGGQITTLGRGGSDTTAIALAASLHADRCDIYSDVDGVYSADPRLLCEAYRLSAISYAEMHELSLNGAQILNARSVEIAMRRRVPVRVRSTFKPLDEGTLVTADARQETTFTGLACTFDQDYVRVCFPVPLSSDTNLRAIRHKRLLWKKVIVERLSEAGLHVEVGTALKSTVNELHFCVGHADVPAVLQAMSGVSLEGEFSTPQIDVHSRLSKISIVGREIGSSVEIDAIRALTKSGLHIFLMTSSEHRLSLFVPADCRDVALKVLHQCFAGQKRAA